MQEDEQESENIAKFLHNTIRKMQEESLEEGAINAKKRVLLRQMELKYGITENEKNRIRSAESSWMLDLALEDVVRDVEKRDLLNRVH